MENISSMLTVSPVNNLQKTDKIEKTPAESQTNFAEMLKATINNVNDAQAESELKTDALAKGEIDDLHEVMIAGQKASILTETTVQVQRKVIDAYNEVMRMQV